jgi:hypothetical protein
VTDLDTAPAPAWAAARERLRSAIVAQRTALRPDRALVLTERQQALILDTLETVALRDPGGDEIPWAALEALWELVAQGEEYVNATDELVRKTLEKRALEAAVRRLNARIADLDEQVVEELIDRGDRGGKHDATGASYSMGRKVWAKLDCPLPEHASREDTDAARANVKAAAGRALIDIGLGDMVREDFNLNTLSAYFREQIREYDEAQRALPEHERAPKAAHEFLPAELRGLIELDDTPHITVRHA